MSAAYFNVGLLCTAQFASFLSCLPWVALRRPMREKGSLENGKLICGVQRNASKKLNAVLPHLILLNPRTASLERIAMRLRDVGGSMKAARLPGLSSGTKQFWWSPVAAMAPLYWALQSWSRTAWIGKLWKKFEEVSRQEIQVLFLARVFFGLLQSEWLKGQLWQCSGSKMRRVLEGWSHICPAQPSIRADSQRRGWVLF